MRGAGRDPRHRLMRHAFLFLPLAMAACSAPSGPTPSLAPRAAEAIDPRVPIPSTPPAGPVDPALQGQLARLLDEVRAGNREFLAAAGEAERLVSAAGDPASESWIAAQQALSGLVAARGRTARALSDIDAIAAQSLMTAGGSLQPTSPRSKRRQARPARSTGNRPGWSNLSGPDWAARRAVPASRRRRCDRRSSG